MTGQTLRQALADRGNFWAAGGDGVTAADRDAISHCASELFDTLDQHPDGPALPGNEPAKVIVVTERGDPDRPSRDRRYEADRWSRDGTGALAVFRNGTPVAEYGGGAWLSVRDNGAEAPDATARALAIAHAALKAAWAEVCSTPAREMALGETLLGALHELIDLGFE